MVAGLRPAAAAQSVAASRCPGHATSSGDVAKHWPCGETAMVDGTAFDGGKLGRI